jgi:four helix bundle protein
MFQSLKIQEDNDYTDKLLASQLFRSGTSIGANIEEAYSGTTTPDFINKLTISLKEARETSYWLRLLKNNSNYSLDSLITEVEEIKRILGKTIVTKKSNR